MFQQNVHDSFEHNGYVIQICQDDCDHGNPLDDDEAIQAVDWSGHGLGTCEDYVDPQDFDDFCEANGVVRVPIYIYEHGGITVSSEPFGCRWDSGQAGWVYLTAEAIKEHGIPNPEAQLRNAVKRMDDWIQGNVWGYRILRKCGCCGTPTEVVDSCWGFFGDPDDKNTWVKEAALDACPDPSPVLAI